MSFSVNVTSRPKGEAKGRYQCEITDRGLALQRGQKHTIHVPKGSPATHTGNNKLTVQLEDRELEMTVSKFGIYQNRLARDLARFLNGNGPPPDPSAYGIEWYFYVIAVLPLGIPVITLGGAIWGALGGGLLAGCFGVAQQDQWPKWVRLLVSGALVGGGYLILVIVLMAVGQLG